MTETDRQPTRVASRRNADTEGGMRAAFGAREWLWQMSGLILACVVGVVIASLTLTPVNGSVSVGGIDKIYHFVAFGALIFPLIVTDSRRWAWAVPAVIAFGGAIELIQPTVGRSAEWLDFGADVAGVLAGAALAEILHDRIRASVFDSVARDDDVVSGPDERQIETMRAELVEELRVVLRQELAAIRRPGAEDPVGPSPAEGAVPVPDPAGRTPPRLHH